MLNQASREALYSATYLEDYLDCVENLPDDLQRLLTRLRELDIRYQSVLGELERRHDTLQRDGQESQRSRTLVTMQRSLIFLQEVADEKLNLLQNIHDLVDNKSRQLELDCRNLDYGKDGACGGAVADASPPGVVDLPGGRVVRRRPRRGRVSDRVAIAAAADDAEPSDTGEELAPGAAATARHKQTRAVVAAQSGAAVIAKRRRRKVQQERVESPMEVPIDPDEPTYCLCEQVFFGEMIGCDNDLCPIEWFHFSCVNIVNKPKGKWYCPRCRGDRTNVMKPKHVFLKELQKYNKQKEDEREKKMC